MISDIMSAAEALGINAFITNSAERIENQLNRITKIEQLPIMLVNWDLETSLTFNSEGFLNNPITNVTCLLMTKAEENRDIEYQTSAEAMALLFQNFLVGLNSNLRTSHLLGENAVTNASYTLVPVHGAGKHSGVLGRFSFTSAVTRCTTNKDLR